MYDYSVLELFCNRTWDGLLCWPDTAAANVAAQRCPDYINLFNKKGEHFFKEYIET